MRPKCLVRVLTLSSLISLLISSEILGGKEFCQYEMTRIGDVYRMKRQRIIEEMTMG
jgi:hypothetical protein